MHISTALAGLVLAVTPSLVTAAGQLGFSLGAVTATGANKTSDDYMADFQAIKQNTGSNLVRIYAASQSNSAAAILPAAKASGFQVIVGIWVINGSTSDPSFLADMAAVQAVAPEYSDQIYAVTVGSEGVYRGNYTAQDIVDKINIFRSTVPSVQKVGTADTWNMYTEGQMDPLIMSDSVNILMGNAFAYWQNNGVQVDNATYTYFGDMASTVTYIQDKKQSLDAIEVWTGETGWPTDGGSNYGASIAGTSQAQTFWDDGVCSMLGWGGNVFYFEAFDEPSKANATGQDGDVEVETKWGAMTVDRQPKFDLSCNEHY